jgi:hypothetical protein
VFWRRYIPTQSPLVCIQTLSAAALALCIILFFLKLMSLLLRFVGVVVVVVVVELIWMIRALSPSVVTIHLSDRNNMSY